ncbi:Hypothetical protein FKW44_004547 [Caligus rogercresseyi]|uniref:Uncharacterized protein n=1 Tax=Caligus rogercresseyi TaxID=217165 RepID=A0A7T8HLZ6_CALRO|nr:Hypothetical protein FKW44_004547 [Caligus rogercresseyi]
MVIVYSHIKRSIFTCGGAVAWARHHGDHDGQIHQCNGTSETELRQAVAEDPELSIPCQHRKPVIGLK